jgi:DNA polymerase alpha subunit B
MDDATTELTERFERYCHTKDHEFPADVLNELQSMLRLYSISPEELDFKWQAYNMKMGGEENMMDLKTVRDFKKTIQDALERESRGKAQQRNDVKRVQPTPRAKGGDMYDMYVTWRYECSGPGLMILGWRAWFPILLDRVGQMLSTAAL